MSLLWPRESCSTGVSFPFVSVECVYNILNTRFSDGKRNTAENGSRCEFFFSNFPVIRRSPPFPMPVCAFFSSYSISHSLLLHSLPLMCRLFLDAVRFAISSDTEHVALFSVLRLVFRPLWWIRIVNMVNNVHASHGMWVCFVVAAPLHRKRFSPLILCVCGRRHGRSHAICTVYQYCWQGSVCIAGDKSRKWHVSQVMPFKESPVISLCLLVYIFCLWCSWMNC